jgi:hypothetical protein
MLVAVNSVLIAVKNTIAMNGMGIVQKYVGGDFLLIATNVLQLINRL